jgi:hypothetical protein
MDQQPYEHSHMKYTPPREVRPSQKLCLVLMYVRKVYSSLLGQSNFKKAWVAAGRIKCGRGVSALPPAPTP